MLFGEKMPDKNDPQYKERYERDVAAGRKFAKATRIDKMAAKVQGFANAHRTLFLVLVFTFVIGVFAWNAYRLVAVYRHRSVTPHGYGDAGFGAASAAQAVARGRNEGE